MVLDGEWFTVKILSTGFLEPVLSLKECDSLVEHRLFRYLNQLLGSKFAGPESPVGASFGCFRVRVGRS